MTEFYLLIQGEGQIKGCMEWESLSIQIKLPNTEVDTINRLAKEALRFYCDGKHLKLVVIKDEPTQTTVYAEYGFDFSDKEVDASYTEMLNDEAERSLRNKL